MSFHLTKAKRRSSLVHQVLFARCRLHMAATGIGLLSVSAVGAMDLGPTTVTSLLGQPLVAEVEVANVKEKPTWSLAGASVSRDGYINAGLGYAPVLDLTKVTLRRRADGSRFLLVTLPQALPAGVDDVLLNVSWDEDRQAQSYRLFNGPRSTPVVKPAAAVALAPIAAAVVAKPVQPLPTDSDDLVRQRLQDRVAAWAAAWEGQDINNYLAMYDVSFKSAGHASRKAWEAERRQRITPRSDINVGVSAMIVTRESTSAAKVEFTQRYVSGVYSDVVRKRLDFVERAGQWYITGETVLR